MSRAPSQIYTIWHDEEDAPIAQFSDKAKAIGYARQRYHKTERCCLVITFHSPSSPVSMASCIELPEDFRS
ncbi:hypothetical protein SAMN05444161_8892 [Rhizobiales bacterium GAS191]|nr:hypothetical protein SAMN05444161_8892 [Rhizobiales bacterium GAS191]